MQIYFCLVLGSNCLRGNIFILIYSNLNNCCELYTNQDLIHMNYYNIQNYYKVKPEKHLYNVGVVK